AISDCAFWSTSSTRASLRRELARSDVTGLPLYDAPAVADVLIYADTIRSPEMRHEVPLAVPDPFLYAERDGQQHVVLSSFELDRRAEVAPNLNALPYEELGIDELYAQGLSRPEIELETILRAARRFGVERAVVPATFPLEVADHPRAHRLVPATFPLEVADHLRANGIEVTADREYFVQRRRVKNDAELAGIRRAQRAAEGGVDAAPELLR